MRRTVLCALAVTVLASCGGPTVDTEVGMREYGVDIVYGDGSRPAPPPPPPAAESSPGFPGFIEPPAPRIPNPPAGGAVPTTTTTLAGPPPTISGLGGSCPAADRFAVPAQAASVQVAGTPDSGTYPFRQQGTSRVGADDPVSLPPEAARTVSTSTRIVAGVTRFDVTIEQYGSTTTTTYQVDQRGVDDGLFIAQIRTTDDLGTQAFTPTVPIKIMQLPATVNASWSSTGSDPLSATAMTVHGKIVDRQRVDACGTVVDGWRVEIGPDPETGTPSSIVSGSDQFEIRAVFVIATQLGGLIVHDEVSLVGTSGVDQAEITAAATISSLQPEQVAG